MALSPSRFQRAKLGAGAGLWVCMLAASTSLIPGRVLPGQVPVQGPEAGLLSYSSSCRGLGHRVRYSAWESSRGRSMCSGLCIQAGVLDRVPGSWLPSGPGWLAAICEVNQWMSEIFLALSLVFKLTSRDKSKLNAAGSHPRTLQVVCVCVCASQVGRRARQPGSGRAADPWLRQQLPLPARSAGPSPLSTSCN